MIALTNEDYFNILLQGCKEAFENLEIKEFLSTPEGLTYNDENGQIILSNETIERLSQEQSHKMIINYNLQDMVDRSFLVYLERQQLIFKKKYLIERHDFYKRCLTVLNIKRLENYRKNGRKPLRNFSDLGDNPDTFEYLVLIMHHLEQRAKKPVLIRLLKNPETEKLSVKQIALKLAYENRKVNKENANEIINEYGHTSGQKLILEFNQVCTSIKRTTDPDKTKKVLENKIKLFKTVAEIVDSEREAKVMDEVRILESHLLKY
jgi:hypothetical protein